MVVILPPLTLQITLNFLSTWNDRLVMGEVIKILCCLFIGMLYLVRLEKMLVLLASLKPFPYIKFPITMKFM